MGREFQRSENLKCALLSVPSQDFKAHKPQKNLKYC